MSFVGDILLGNPGEECVQCGKTHCLPLYLPVLCAHVHFLILVTALIMNS